MSEPNWAEAPDGATHHASWSDIFYKVEGHKVFGWDEIVEGVGLMWCTTSHDLECFISDPRVTAAPPKPPECEEWIVVGLTYEEQEALYGYLKDYWTHFSESASKTLSADQISRLEDKLAGFV